LGCLFNLVGYPVLLVLLFYRKVVLYCSKWRHKTWIPINIASGHFAVDVVNAHGLKAFGCCLDVDKSFDYKGWIERIQKFLDSEKVKFISNKIQKRYLILFYDRDRNLNVFFIVGLEPIF
jgi:hypothetical protein